MNRFFRPFRPLSRRWQWLLLLFSIIAVGMAIWLFATGTSFPSLFRRDTTWETMQSRGTWRVGIDPSFPPFEQLDAQNQIVGFDVDLAQTLATSWGLKLEIVPTSFDSLIDALRSGQVDSVLSALPYDPRLTKDVIYSSPYFEAGIMLVVRADSALQSADDLLRSTAQTATVAVELGSAGDVIARRWQKENEQAENGAGAKSTISVARYETPEDAILALQNDPAISALLIDNVSLRLAQGRATQENGAPIKAIGATLESNPYVIAIPIHATELQQILEESLRDLLVSNDFKAIENKWFDKGETNP